MSGLLGFMAAGAAEGFAQGRSKEIAARQEFDLKTALLEAQTEKEMLLQERGIKLKEDAEQRGRDKVTGLIGSVKDPMEGKGGYEPPEAAEKRTVEMARQKANVLRENGYIEEAKSFDSVVDQYNKGELSRVKLENEVQKINNNFELKAKDLELKGEKNKAQIAEMQTKNNAPRKTDTELKKESFIAAYSDDPEIVKNGNLTKKGWDKFYKAEEKSAFDKIITDEQPDPITGKPIVKRRIESTVPAGTAKPEPKVFTYDPKARSLF